MLRQQSSISRILIIYLVCITGSACTTLFMTVSSRRVDITMGV